MLKESEKLLALAKEARRRGTTYGQLVSALSVEEQEKIYIEFEREKKKKK